MKIMRRSDREVSSAMGILDILSRCSVMRMGMCSGNIPYVVPMNFGYEYEDDKWVFYFHCAGEGKKLDILQKNNAVFLEADCSHELTAGENACSYGYNYESVMAEGNAAFLTDHEEKAHALSILMKHQTGKDFTFNEAQTAGVTVIKVSVTTITAKCRRA